MRFSSSRSVSTDVLRKHVRSALTELADLDYQARVWTGTDPVHEMSSFIECVERLFDDSGLGYALEKGPGAFGSEIDHDLAAVGELVDEIDTEASPHDLIHMQVMRARAAELLRRMDTDGPAS